MHSFQLLAVAALAFNANALIINSFSRCGAQTWNILTCKHSLFGHCCSKDGHCGNSPAYCGTGCQKGFGTCNPPVPTTRPAMPSSTTISKTSTVQATSRATSSSIVVSSSSTFSVPIVSSTVIASSSSTSSVVVTSSPTIATSSSSSSTITPSVPEVSTSGEIPSTTTTSSVPMTSGQVSLDGQCGANNGGAICLGSTYGDCCSEHGWCGSTTGHCGTGCQVPFGECSSTSPVSPTPSSPSTPAPICGVEGFANNNDYYASSFNLLDTTDVSLCATKCLAEPTCQSYLFNPLQGNCAYLVYSLQQGEFIATDDTDQLFWERACAEQAN